MKKSLINKIKKYLYILYDSHKFIKIKVSSNNESIFYKYCIEEVIYKNNILNVNGWIFNKDKKINSLTLLLVNEGEEYRLTSINSFIERQDVYSFYGNENSLFSGFSYKAKIERFNKISIYLEVNEYERILIYRMKKSLFDKIEFYAKKLTLKNLKKLFIFVRKKKINDLKQSFEKFVVEELDKEIYSANLPQFLNHNIINSIEYPSELYTLTIDIIIPIYNGYEYLERLINTISYTKMKYRIIAINDKSTDIRIKEFLDKYKENNNIILLENENNQGFVKSVNKGLNIATNHVVLLNTDVELPDMWLERLMIPIIVDNNIATSTPFTNCGTICSFPEFCKDNVIFENLDVNYIDKVFLDIKPRYTHLPTGVGFCMGINKKALNEVGFLDEDVFGKGYCEENDWCQRAIKVGYKNVQVENLYVYHKHGGSFDNEEKKMLLENNIKLLSQRHTNYLEDVKKFCNNDPLRDIREYVIFKILSSKNYDTSVYFNHGIGGGATKYLDEKVNEKITNKKSIIIINYEHLEKRYLFKYKYKNYHLVYNFIEFSDIIDILEGLNIKKIYINELVTYPNLYDILEKISNYKERKNVEMIMLLHDFFCMCPTVNLIDDNGFYCGVSNINICEKCLKNNLFNNYAEYESIKKWLNKWEEFLNKCDKIIAFSEDSKSLLQKRYNYNENIVVIPHEVNYLKALNKKGKTTNTVNIGLIGTLNYHKGSNVIKGLLEVIEKKSLPINIILIGNSDDKITHKNFRQTGKYNIDNLMKLIIDNDVDLFFISSIWPETFSYTTQEIINMDMPIVSFDMGAQAEKIRKYNKGLILNSLDSNEILEHIIKFSKEFTF